MKYKHLLWVLLLVGCADAQTDPLAPLVGPGTCTVLSVTDGDTIRCAEFAERIRLAEIDAPESAQSPFGAQATAELQRLVNGRTLRLEYDQDLMDDFGRWLPYAFSGTQMINEQMVSNGFAVAFIVAPNNRYETIMRNAESAARAARRGLWAVDGFRCLPVDFRAGRCS